MRGLSGAVTALILVVASVVIALIVVGFAFNLLNAFGSQGVNAVSPVGPACIYTKAPPGITTSGTSGTTNVLFLNVTIDNRGPSVNIMWATINGQIVSSNQITVYNSSGSKIGTHIPAGQNPLVIVFGGVNPSTVGSGPANIQLVLANGQTVYIATNVTE
ncbi:MAG: hypothetical protein L7H12_03225 [Sulfolobales archaeon]|nr:hypothetical protein [Sulfolobales archaeon]MCG2884433.1 hypothetical protein [Sulfolobales archaeon]MCG2907933.1 hypothetical protein [Sulfolobales archaeon]